MAKRKPEPEIVSSALADPVGYARVRLNKKLHPKQERVLRDTYANPGSHTVALCGNGVGKTSSILTSAILYQAEILKGLFVSTAGVRRQVEEQLWPNLTLYRHLYPRWDFSKKLSIRDESGRVRYLGFTAANEGNFQGFHNLDGPLTIAIDESAAVRDEIIMAAEERCDPTYFLLLGSPLDPQGMLYQASTSLAHHYKQNRITQLDCTTDKGWWLNPADIQRRIEKYGPEHPLVLSMVYADFSLKVEGALLSLREWEAAIEDPPMERGHDRHVFLDFAAGRARNSLGCRVGNRAWIQKSWREQNTMAAIGEFLAQLNRLAQPPPRGISLKPHEVEGDADGMGIVFIHALEEAGWPIQHFHGGGAPLGQDEDYANRISEVWREGTVAIRKKEFIIAPPGTEPSDPQNRQMNEQLKAQIIVRKGERDSKGRLAIESKEKLAKRGVESPDDGDALLGAMARCPLGRSVRVMGEDPADLQRFVEEAASGAGGIQWPEGADFG